MRFHIWPRVSPSICPEASGSVWPWLGHSYEAPNSCFSDEPFAALDTLLRVKLRNELLAIQARFKVPVIMITHDPEDIRVFAETLVTYEAGRVCKVDSFLKTNGEKHLSRVASQCSETSFIS